MSTTIWMGVLAAVGLTAPAWGQAPGGDTDGWRVSAGATVLVLPFYPGDEDYRVLPVPYFDIAYGDRFTADIPNGLRYRLVKDERFEFGVGVAGDFGRDEENAAILEGLGDLGPSIGPQVFARYNLGRWSVSGVVIGDVADGHGGVTAEASLSYRVFASRSTGVLATSVGVGAGDETYVASVFGIDADQAARSAAQLPEFATNAGVTEVSVGATYVRPITRKVSFVTTGSVARLVGDAADSPLTVEDTQFFGQATLAYRF